MRPLRWWFDDARRWWKRHAFIEQDMGRAGKLWVRPEFNAADCWIGAYVKVERSKYHDNYGEVEGVQMWLCVLPCLLLHFTWYPWQDEVPF